MGVGLQRIGLHPHPRSSRRVNIIFTFWSRTPHISFVVYFSASFLFLSLSHVLSFVALFITTSIIDKKKPNIRSSRFFFFIYLKSIEQQQLSAYKKHTHTRKTHTHTQHTHTKHTHKKNTHTHNTHTQNTHTQEKHTHTQHTHKTHTHKKNTH